MSSSSDGGASAHSGSRSPLRATHSQGNQDGKQLEEKQPEEKQHGEKQLQGKQHEGRHRRKARRQHTAPTELNSDCTNLRTNLRSISRHAATEASESEREFRPSDAPASPSSLPEINSNEVPLTTSIALLSATNGAGAAQSDGSTALVTVEYLKAQLHEFETRYHLGLQQVVSETEERHRQKECVYRDEIHYLKETVCELRSSIHITEDSSARRRMSDMGSGCCLSAGLLVCLFSPHAIFGGLCCLVGGLALSIREAWSGVTPPRPSLSSKPVDLATSSRAAVLNAAALNAAAFNASKNSDATAWPSVTNSAATDGTRRTDGFGTSSRNVNEMTSLIPGDDISVLVPCPSLLATASCSAPPPRSITLTPPTISVVPDPDTTDLNEAPDAPDRQTGPTSSWGTAQSGSRHTPDSWITRLRMKRVFPRLPFAADSPRSHAKSHSRLEGRTASYTSAIAASMGAPPSIERSETQTFGPSVANPSSTNSFRTFHGQSYRTRRRRGAQRLTSPRQESGPARDSKGCSMFYRVYGAAGHSEGCRYSRAPPSLISAPELLSAPELPFPRRLEATTEEAATEEIDPSSIDALLCNDDTA